MMYSNLPGEGIAAGFLAIASLLSCRLNITSIQNINVRTYVA